MTAPNRINLRINIFNAHDQHADVATSVTPVELIAAIITEFGYEQHPYLSSDPAAYQLCDAAGNTLTDDRAIGARGSRLTLGFRTPSVPPEATALDRPLLLREEKSGIISVVAWTPALIGRATPQPNSLLAVDLRNHPKGMKVSRQHARIVQIDGKLQIEGIAEPNRTILRTSASVITLGAGTRHPLGADDVIEIVNTEIMLTVLPAIKEG